MSENKVNVDMLGLFKAELELCKVRAGEVVAIISAGDEKIDYAQAFMDSDANWTLAHRYFLSAIEETRKIEEKGF